MKSLTTIRSIVALLILCHQVLTYNLTYSELEHLEGSCFPFDLCFPHRFDKMDHLWGNYTCECEIHCVSRGTCCIDSSYVGRNSSAQDRGETCQKPPGFVDNVELISRCPNETSDSQVKEECERIHQYGDPLIMSPTTSLETNITYKNYFCALCNHDARHLAFWKIHMVFPSNESYSQVSNVTEEHFLENLMYSYEHKTWGVKTENSFHGIKMSFTLPPDLQKIVKRCYPGMVSECDPSYADNYELLYKCSSYYAPIKGKKTKGPAKVYRNVHCAMCNNVHALQKDAICMLEDHEALMHLLSNGYSVMWDYLPKFNLGG